MASDVTIDRDRMTVTLGGEVFGLYEGDGWLDVFAGAGHRGGLWLGRVTRESLAIGGAATGSASRAVRAVCRLVAAAWWSDDSSRGERRED